jgi:hypothetical protein
MTEEEYITHWRARAIAAEVRVEELRDKLVFWRVTGISFGIVVLIITLLV